MKNDQIQKINFLKQNRIEKNELYKSCGPIYENFLRIGEIQFFSLSIIVKYSKIHRRNSPWTPPSLPPGHSATNQTRFLLDESIQAR